MAYHLSDKCFALRGLSTFPSPLSVPTYVLSPKLRLLCGYPSPSPLVRFVLNNTTPMEKSSNSTTVIENATFLTILNIT